MTECERCECSLSAWLDGEEGNLGRLEIVDHLVRCAGCRRFYVEGRALAGLTTVDAARADDGPGAERWARIVAASEEARPRRRARPPAWALRAAAVLLMAAGLAYALWTPQRPVRQAVSSPVEVVLGENPGAMTESRLIELTAEVLRADRRFHHELYRVMEQVVSDTGAAETSRNETDRDTESVDSGESSGESRHQGPERA